MSQVMRQEGKKIERSCQEESEEYKIKEAHEDAFKCKKNAKDYYLIR